jgi:hypothetical protein
MLLFGSELLEIVEFLVLITEFQQSSAVFEHLLTILDSGAGVEHKFRVFITN